ncbi:MAG: hypothetical protein IJS14_11155 [Lentisphaeria bacterium]|nr:hypothetical protein [Lentisphaeria bacterium]
MSYIVIEPLSIKVRRLVEKITNIKDPKVKEFDEMHRKMFNASHGIFDNQTKDDKSGIPPVIK